MRCRALLLTAALLARAAIADQASSDDARPPPPDPRRGERADGRTDPPSTRDPLRVPRTLLSPLLWAWDKTEESTRASTEWERRHQIFRRLYDAVTSEDGQIGVRPTVSWTSSFRPSFGVHFFDDKLMGWGTTFDATVEGGPDVARVVVRGRPTLATDRLQLFFDGSYNHRDDFLYTGIGASAKPQPGQLPAARYRGDVVDLDVRTELRASRVFTFSAGGWFGLRRFGDGAFYGGDPPILSVYCVRDASGSCVDGVSEALVPGFNSGTQFLRGSLGLHLNLRKDPLGHLGGLLDVEGDYTRGLGDDRSSYFRFRAAATVGISLWRNSHVLVLRSATELVLPSGGDGSVPFTELVVLGGSFDLRGFRAGAFRDFSSLVNTVEYRWPIYMWADGTLFVDYGGVFGRLYDRFGARQMQPDVGVGLRIRTGDRFVLRTQVAYGFDGGWRILFSGSSLP